MTAIPITKPRTPGDLGNRASLLGERVVVERRGRTSSPCAVEDVELLERLEDKLDLDAIRAPRMNFQALAEVKKALGCSLWPTVLR